VPSAAELNKDVVRRFLEAWVIVDLDTMRELMAPDFVDRSVRPGEGSDRESYLRGVVEDDAALSIAHFNIEDQIVEGDKVVTRYTSRGRHDRGKYMGLAPTGEDFEVTGMIIHRIAGGKIIEEWTEGTAILEMTERLVAEEKIERERVEQELRVAQRIQRSSLPEAVPTLEGWEISPLYRPAREAGGDFYDFFELKDGRLGLVVGDATGKGVPAALVMSTTCGMLGALALSLDSPGEVLERVNEALFVRIPSNMFVTCFYVILDPKNGRLATPTQDTTSLTGAVTLARQRN
jgi:predicted ester cyclase